jgi:hypothetical protein
LKSPERKHASWRRAALKYNFGITPEQHQQMFEAQGGKCACCGSSHFGGKYNRPAVDHCHSTQRVRGLLCFRCNVGLGIFEKCGAMFEAYLKAASPKQEAA